MRRIYLSVLTLVLGSFLLAGGYRVSLQGVRQASMGTIGSVDVSNASVAFYNPAGLAFVPAKISVAAGGFGIVNKVKWQNQAILESAETDNPLGTPIYAAVSYRPFEDITVGVSFTTPFGSKLVWDEGWAGQGNITEIDLKSYFIQPTVAVKFNDWFSAGVGFIYGMGSVNLQKTVFVAGNNTHLELDSKDGHGLGFNVGAFFRPSERLDISLAYRSPIDMKVNGGDALWSNVPLALGGAMPFAADQFSAGLPLVSEFTAGMAFRATERLLLAGEVSVHGWSRYTDLDIALENSNNGDITHSISTKNWKDRAVWKVGAEYKTTDYLDVRLGYLFDEFVAPSEHWSPETPDATRHNITGGVGLHFGNFTVDAAAQYIFGQERYVNNIKEGFSGDVKVKAFVFGLGLSYNFN